MTVRITDQELYDALVRNDFMSFVEVYLKYVAPAAYEGFVPNWHHEVIAHTLMDALENPGRRIAIFGGPRTLKSLMVSVLWPAWLLGNNPACKIICASHSMDLVGKHSRDFGQVIRTEEFDRTFARFRLATDREAHNDIITTMRGGRFATSPGGPGVGRGCDWLLLDDLHKPDEIYSAELRDRPHRWLLDTALSRFDDKTKGNAVLVMQRLHTDDVGGRARDAGWEVLEFPAYTDRDRTYSMGGGLTHTFRAGEYLQPDREGKTVLDQIRREVGTPLFNAQYLQAPEELSGGLVRFDYLHFYDGELAVLPGDYVLQSWDVAMSDEPSADWSVCTTWILRSGALYLLNVWRARQGLPDLIASAKRLAREYSVDEILVETDGVGIAFWQYLRNGIQPNRDRHRDLHAEGRLSPRTGRGEYWDPKDILIRGHRVRGSKAERLVACTPHFQSGKVRLPRLAPWKDVYMHELLTFTEAGGGFDDQVDSTSAAIKRLATRPGPPVLNVRVY